MLGNNRNTPDPGAVSGNSNCRRFAIALSFPGEHRDFVEQVARHLASTFGKEQVLYDKYHDAEFARLDLNTYLPALYRKESELIVLFLCPEYAAKLWCRLEWRNISQLIATVDAKRIMFLSFGHPGDLSDLGILRGDGYIDVVPLAPQTVAEKIVERLHLNQGGTAPKMPPVPVDTAQECTTVVENLKCDPPGAPSDQELYCRSFVGKYGTTKILDMTTPFDVGRQSVNARVINPIYRREIRSALSMSRELSERLNSSHSNEQTFDLATIAEEITFLNVLGPPGSGKTTFLRNVGIAVARKRCQFITAGKASVVASTRSSVPLLLEMRTLPANDFNLFKAVKAECESMQMPYRYIESLFQNGDILLLLDGLDEVPEVHVSAVVDSINTFTSNWRQNRFITTCRSEAYTFSFANSVDFELCAFSNNEITQFICRWFSEDKKAKALEKKLFSAGNEALLETARTPLLLTYICLLAETRQNIPSCRGKLYDQMVELIMKRWRLVSLATIGYSQRRKVVECFAGRSREREDFFFGKREMGEEIEQILFSATTTDEQPLSAQPIPTERKDGIGFVEEVAKFDGLFVLRARDVYSFSHLTLYEFLAASFFAKSGDLNRIIHQKLYAERWKDIFVFACGLDQPADHILQAIADFAVQERPSEIDDLWRWSNVAIVRGRSIELDILARVSAIFFLLHALPVSASEYARPTFVSQELQLRAHRMIETANRLVAATGSQHQIKGINTEKLLAAIGNSRNAFFLNDKLREAINLLRTISAAGPEVNHFEWKRRKDALRQFLTQDLGFPIDHFHRFILNWEELSGRLSRDFYATNLFLDCRSAMYSWDDDGALTTALDTMMPKVLARIFHSDSGQ